MKQPTKAEITAKIKAVLSKRMSREELGDWANDLIMNYDAEMTIEDWDAWEYLKEVGYFDIQDTPDTYLYSEDELRQLVKRYST
jgi:hypothetical protein